MSVKVVPTERWSAEYPGAMIGILGMRGLENPDLDPALQGRATQLEAQIRARFAGSDRTMLVATPTLSAYASYYRRFGKTYHVQLQLESVLFKGRSIVGPSAIVQAMFMAELKSQLLTAGHDLPAVQGGIIVDVSLGSETYVSLGGRQLTLKAGDMFIRDQEGILSSILHGPDQRTRITSDTRAVVFTTYVPPGIPEAVLRTHLADLEANVRLFSPGAEVETCEVVVAA